MWCNCEKLFTGFGPQPSYIDTPEYEEKLNILGVLRPDSLQGRSQSFVHVEKAISIYDVDDSLDIQDVEVTIFELEENIPVDTIQLVYSDFNGFYDKEEYRDSTFFPHANTTYLVRCKKEGFPELLGRTTVPSKPEIIPGTVLYADNNLSFAIQPDSLASLYYIYLEVGGTVFFRQFIKQENENINVEFQLKDSNTVHTATVTIITYDYQLSEYITYNINVKPNTFRENYSTVEKGYGCFGSLNITEEDIYF